MAAEIIREQPEMADTVMPLLIVEAIKKHRLPLSAAVMVAVVLVVFVHAPIIPVLVGCILAVWIAVLRTRSSTKVRNTLQGGR
jgi:hypothetical protein